jgi:Fe-S oxidoreductase/FAD/FMN-containing dehydrogenase
VANNATGAHSLEYGYMGDHVESVQVVLADGNIVEFENEFSIEGSDDIPATSIAKACHTLLADKSEVIAAALPETKRNRSGYMIGRICHKNSIDMARLLAGSEGTLGIFTQITLRTVALPKSKGLLQLEFSSLAKATEAVVRVVESGASACEMMDKTLIAMAHKALPQYRDILPGSAEATLLVEHTGVSKKKVNDKLSLTDSAVGDLATGRRIVLDEVGQQRLWKSRKDAVPLLGRNKGRKHPVPFIEDVSVDKKKLGKYISGMQLIASKYGIVMAFYGHAGDGELHIRPYLDLGDPAEVQKMRSIANDVFSLAWSLGGSISGEHADGLVRAAFIRGQYGDEFYELLREIKKIFDPKAVLNPGKIVNNDSEVMTKNLRAHHPISADKLDSELEFEKDELLLELDQCSGCGVCLSRDQQSRMCPVFRAMGEELGSSRAKSNVLRFWASGQMEDRVFESPEFRKLLDLCVNCKACSVECPAGVDVSKIVSAARAEYVQRKGLRPGEIFLSNNRYLSMVGGLFRPISNIAVRMRLVQWILEKIVGFDSRRTAMKFSGGSFVQAGRKYIAGWDTIKEPVDKVAYFVDTYANYNDHELGFAVLDVLRQNSIEVILPNQRPSPLPAICYGDVKTAKRDLRYNVKYLAKAIRDGYKIVCSEPSATLCLCEELRHYVTGSEAELVSANTQELMSYLLELYKKDCLKEPPHHVSEAFVYHSPCHLRASGVAGASIELLEQMCKATVTDLESGCCGLSGTFGMQTKNYDLSEKIGQQLGDALKVSDVHHVLTECSACGMQIKHLSDCEVSHPIKILARAYEV